MNWNSRFFRHKDAVVAMLSATALMFWVQLFCYDGSSCGLLPQYFLVLR